MSQMEAHALRNAHALAIKHLSDSSRMHAFKETPLLLQESQDRPVE